MDNVIITYSGYILFILSSIMAYSQYRGKKKFETDKIELQQDFETRKIEKQIKYDTYMLYISKIDTLNHKLQNNLKSEEMFKTQMEMTSKIFTNPSNSATAIKDYMDKVNRFIAEWGSEQYRSMEELSGVKLVCGDIILKMLDEYSTVTKDYVDTTLEFMSKFPLPYSMNTPSPEIVNFKAKYDRMIQLRTDIIKEMRREIRSADSE